MENKSNNTKAIPILEENGFEVLQFCHQGDESGLFNSDEFMFVNKYTRKVDVVDCTRVIQILRANGYKVHGAQIRVIIEYGILEDPVGELIFEAH
jgi:hypothetical protein